MEKRVIYLTSQVIINFLVTYIVPYLATLLIALVTVKVAFSTSSAREDAKVRAQFRAELITNMKVTQEVLKYADSQLSGDVAMSPMPRYRVGAFYEYKRHGLLERVPRTVRDELEDLYLHIGSVNKAGRRQEELAFGPAAAYPNAHTLRLENLSYVRDETHNIIEPYQDRLKGFRL